MPNQQNDDIVDHRQDSVVEPLPQCGNSQLISYEELSDEDFIQDSLKFQRSLRSMHHYIPHHPFRATVRMTPVAAATSAVVLDGQNQFGNLQVMMTLFEYIYISRFSNRGMIFESFFSGGSKGRSR